MEINYKFEQERLATKDDASRKFNNRLLSREASIYFFLKNCEESIERGGENYFLPDNIKEIATELFSLDKVFVALYPCDDYFNEKGEFVAECSTISYKSLNSQEVIKSVKSYLEKGAVVYIYLYHGMLSKLVVGNKMDNGVPTYWWRMITKKEN